MSLRWIVPSILALVLVCSACVADSTDDRVAYVREHLLLTDVKTEYLKAVLLESLPEDPTHTLLDKAYIYANIAEQRQLLHAGDFESANEPGLTPMQFM